MAGNYTKDRVTIVQRAMRVKTSQLGEKNTYRITVAPRRLVHGYLNQKSPMALSNLETSLQR